MFPFGPNFSSPQVVSRNVPSLLMEPVLPLLPVGQQSKEQRQYQCHRNSVGNGKPTLYWNYKHHLVCGESVSDRLRDTYFIYLMCNDACREVAAFLSALVLARKDMKQHISLFVNWDIELINGEGSSKDSWDKIGPLEGLAMLLKHG
ncbi:hypothetical protein J6590_090593 [Homalodisca vitripennis]|nr:hypothetical protein J6590_090593 [Homalodisca vitripennis]